jgi:uncharacterized protein YdcH (DUF465 family)
MFEHRQDELKELLATDDEFYVLYQRHEVLDEQVTAIEESQVWDDLKLTQLKKEKLHVADKLQHRMWQFVETA